MIQSNPLAALITLIAALTWLRLNDFAAHRGWLESRLSRKIIHIGTGPIFVLCWLLFPDNQASRYWAALVPLAITLQFILIGLGVVKDEAAVKAMSRTGNPREILRGPLFYGLVFVLLTVWFWHDSPIGITALMLMCGGDGLADVLGRRWGNRKLPWSREKSWVGSFGMFIGGWLLALVVLTIYTRVGLFPGTLTNYLLPVSAIALAGTIVETLPWRDIDNLTVTAVAVALGWLFF